MYCADRRKPHAESIPEILFCTLSTKESLSIDESVVTCDISSTIYRLLPKILSIKINMFIKSKYKVSAPKIATFLPTSDCTIT